MSEKSWDTMESSPIEPGQFTDEELMVLLGLVNRALDQKLQEVLRAPARQEIGPGDLVLSHSSNQGSWQTNGQELARKLAREATKRGVIRVPSCFKGKL